MCPDKVSVKDPVTVVELLDRIVPSAGEVTVRAGGVLSILRVTLAVAVKPLASVIVPPTISFVPSAVTIWGAGQLVIAALPAVQVNETVTSELFQPALLGEGETKVEIEGGTITVNGNPLLASPEAVVTTTFPVVAPTGTITVTAVSDQLVIAAETPLKVTARPVVVPKFVPVTVTDVPKVPEFEERLVIAGGSETLNWTPLLWTPDTVTITFPVIAPDGTPAMMPKLDQLTTVAGAPLKVTVLVP